MRQLDEFARLWNDARSRLPRNAWSWPLVAAAAGAVVVLLGSTVPDVGTASNAGIARIAEANAATPGDQPPIEATTACEEQTWPYLNDACLQRTSQGQSGQAPRSNVRVLGYEPEMARAAVGATPWASSKPTVGSPQARQKGDKRQASRDADRVKTVTVRSGRRDRPTERERVYNVPTDAFFAYGFAARR